jgi:hypothetical protein
MRIKGGKSLIRCRIANPTLDCDIRFNKESGCLTVYEEKKGKQVLERLSKTAKLSKHRAGIPYSDAILNERDP